MNKKGKAMGCLGFILLTLSVLSIIFGFLGEVNKISWVALIKGIVLLIISVIFLSKYYKMKSQILPTEAEIKRKKSIEKWAYLFFFIWVSTSLVIGIYMFLVEPSFLSSDPVTNIIIFLFYISILFRCYRSIKYLK